MKSSTRRGLIYFRYLLPIVIIIGMIILMNIPCYYYEIIEFTNDEPVKHYLTEQTLIDRLVSDWTSAKDVLFGGAENEQNITDFAKTNFALIIATVTLFAIGVAFAVYTTVMAFMYFGGKKTSRARALFITLVPNRVVFCIYQLLLLPIFVFPRVLPYISEGMLNVKVTLTYKPFDMMFIAIPLYAIVVFFTFFTVRMETREEMNVFYRQKTSVTPDDIDEEYQTEEQETDEYARMDRKEKEEQAERILRLLNKNKQKQDNEEDK